MKLTWLRYQHRPLVPGIHGNDRMGAQKESQAE